MNTNHKTPKKFVRVVSASAYRRLNSMVNREKKRFKVLRRMKKEHGDK